MLPIHGILRLRGTLDDEFVLIPQSEWFFERAESGYHEVDPGEAVSLLRGLSACTPEAARYFVYEARLRLIDFGRMHEMRMPHTEVLNIIIDAIRDDRVVVVQRGAAPSTGKRASPELRRLVEQIDQAGSPTLRGKLAFQGRHYKLVVDVDLARLPERDHYDVVPQSEARAVLDGIAKESPGAAGALAKAVDKLTKDWHRPSSQPDGLILLRRILVRPTASNDTAPAVTPSQLRKLRAGWISLEVLDDFDRPWSGTVKIELPDGSTRELSPDNEGATSADGFDPGDAVIGLLDLDKSSWDQK